MVMIIVRTFFALFAVITGYHVAPEPLAVAGPLIGLGAAGLVVGLEILLGRVPPWKLFMGVVGLIAGLIAAWLVVDFLFLVPAEQEIENFVRVFLYYFFAYLGITISVRYSIKWPVFGGHSLDAQSRPPLILDSNVIIDGRLYDLVRTGFLDYRLIVPRFVMKELQTIADSSQDIKRQRGRRGLEILNRLRRDPKIDLQIGEADFPEIEETDAKLVQLARSSRAHILTNDFNLARIAEVQNITVLNLNNLSTILKPRYLQGERLMLKIVKPGKESTQGVGYLDDGTMVVVENGRRRLNETIEVQIVNSIQTTTGRMLFAEIT